MRGASRVFVIIGLIASIFLILIGLITISQASQSNLTGVEQAMLIFFGYGGYALVTSIGCLIALSRDSKTAINIMAFLYIPVVLLASIFMFCVRDENYSYHHNYSGNHSIQNKNEKVITFSNEELKPEISDKDNGEGFEVINLQLSDVSIRGDMIKIGESSLNMRFSSNIVMSENQLSFLLFGRCYIVSYKNPNEAQILYYALKKYSNQ